jgi:multidrug efflux pump
VTPRFFIDRPVFAAVLSIVIVIAGLVSMRALPIAQYPDIVPPQVQVTASYAGASPQTVADTVAAPLEQQINGVDDMIYLESASLANGQMTATVTFEIGTDPDQATINVNNRAQRALAMLPSEVQQTGVTVSKQSSSILSVITMYSEDGNYGPIFVSNYALLNVVDELKRVEGVGEAQIFGAKDYSMRIWLRPDKLAQYELTPSDVADAIREQNSQFAAGRFNDEPSPGGRAFTYIVTTTGRLPDAKAFENIILRSDANGSTLRIKDVARVELGAIDYGFEATYNGKPTIAIGIFMQPGANALDTAEAVRVRMGELAERFPAGIAWAMPYDTTKFVEISIEEVIKTFIEAMILVVLVVFIFLQKVRATLIPLMAVPVSIIGTFAGMYVLGFSINLLTLFGLVLAIGIVVDDAIVVLENVERIMTTEGLPPREAAIKAMEEVQGPVIAIVLVLCAVFIPVAFMGGLAGEMYKQFAVTIAVSVSISGIVALTLTPAMCALILKPGHDRPALPFRIFNRGFDLATRGYAAGVRFFLKRAIVGVLLFAGMLYVGWSLFSKIPSSLVPNEDQGYIITAAFLPPAASLERTAKVTTAFSEAMMQQPTVADIITFAGFDILTFGQKSNAGVSFVPLTDWSERMGPGQDSQSIAYQAMGIGSTFRDAFILAFNPPPISGMSTTGGFEGYVQDRSGAGSQALADKVQELIAAAAKRPELTGLNTTFSTEIPQYRLDVDREKAKALGVPIASIFEAMQATFGSLYVNDFTLFGRNYRVNLQAEAAFRERPEDLKQVFVRSDGGSMIPIDTLVTVHRTIGPDTVTRFNLFPAAKFLGGPAPGYSSGQAIEAMEEVAREVLGTSYALGWVTSAYQETEAAGTGSQAFLFAIVMVFLILAAQYERWSLPFAVILAVPFALVGALAAIWLRGLDNDVYFQIGLVTLIGLAAKNAILIVEFAIMKRREGLSAADAALAAAKLRFRPIIMTSLAFILGCVPLAISTGAGSASRHSIGTGVIGGMLAATFLAIFFIPMFYSLIARKAPKPKRGAPAAPAGPTGPADGAGHAAPVHPAPAE